MIKVLIKLSGLVVFVALVQGCGGSSNSGGSGQSYPLVTPPVSAATPQGFGGTAALLFQDRVGSRALVSPTLDPADFKSRFFTNGPTNIFTILASIDSRIAGFNGSTSKSACLSQTPVPYTLSFAGQSIQMYAQCYQNITPGFSGDPGLVQWGVKNGAFYIWTAIGAGWTAAIATPINGSTQYSVQAWASVGIGNGVSGNSGGQCGTSWDNCSYGVMEVSANPVTKSLEMSVAGLNIGYCGAQYISDGTNIYGKGSVDGGGCQAIGTICVLASDASTTGTCTNSDLTFTLTPLGRNSGTGVAQPTFAASTYPATSLNVTLSGTASDSVHFGPTSPTAGVGPY